MSLELPFELDGGTYRLVTEIGRGGMATVYTAEVDLDRFDFHQLLARSDMSRSESRRISVQDLHSAEDARGPAELIELCEARGIRYPGRRVAVKVASTGNQSQRFRDEWLGLMALDHPNVIRVYDGGAHEPAELEYYVLELVEAPLPADALQQLKLREKLDVIGQAARGLRALHRVGLIHRDIKPSNLLVSREVAGLRVRVTDLGIAKDIERSLELTRSQAIIGTPSYMPPEVIRSARAATPRSDIYSLGATLYTLVCGRRPYDGDSLYAILTNVIGGQSPVPAHQLAADCPPVVSSLIARMMAHDPAARPPDTDALIFEIDTVATELELGAAQRTIVFAGDRPTVDRAMPADAAPCRLVVAESDELTRDLLARFLERAGYAVETASDGAEALVRLGASDVDLLLAADDLPVLDSNALIRAVRSQGLDLPIIRLSDGRRTTPQTDAELGLVDVVQKPIALPALVTKLEHIRRLLD